MLRAYSQDDITILYYEGCDIHNTPLATTDVEMKAYIAWGTHMISNIAGEEVVGSPRVSRAIVYVMPAREITHADKIKIDDIEYVITEIKPGKDFSENHQEIHLQ